MEVLRRKSVEQSIRDTEESEHQLRRSLGPIQLTAIGIGVIIGTGIFVLTGEAAGTVAGPAITLSFVAAAIVCGLAGLCYAVDNPAVAAFYPMAVFSPEWVALRWAVAHGRPARFLDLPAANALVLREDKDADRFDPHRAPRHKVKQVGLAFGEGPHTCIGAVMSVGEISAHRPGPDDPLGLVPYTLRELFRAGVTPAGEGAQLNPGNARGEFTTFPVRFGAIRTNAGTVAEAG